MVFLDPYLIEENVYLVIRGTRSKEGIIAREYNIKYNQPSHVGILVNIMGQWHIYHVLNTKNDKSALLSQTPSEFLNIEIEKIDYAAILSVKINKECVVKKIKKIGENKIIFDREFSLENGDKKLYCSEFIIKVLEFCSTDTFDFTKHKIQLKPFPSLMLRKDSLEYYPVDIFMTTKNISLINEWYFD